MEPMRNDIVLNANGNIDYPTMAKHLGNELTIVKMEHGITDSTMEIAGGLFLKQYSITQEKDRLNYSLTDPSTNLFQKIANRIKLASCTKNLKDVESQINRLPFNKKTFQHIKEGLERSDSMLKRMESTPDSSRRGAILNYTGTIIETISLINRLQKKE